MSCATHKEVAENRTCTNVCYEYECAMSHENGLQKIECFTLSSIPPLPLCLLLSRGVARAHERQTGRETDRHVDKPDIQTHRQTDRPASRQTDRQTDRQARVDSLVSFASPQPSAASLTNLKHWHTLSLPHNTLISKGGRSSGWNSYQDTPSPPGSHLVLVVFVI